MINRKKLIRFSILAVLLLALVLWIIWSNGALTVTEITVTGTLPDAFRGYRIAQVSDLHNADFGDKNGKLLTLLKECAPDIIVITGDLVDSRRTDIDVALAFGREAVKIAPTYYVTGNHEARISQYSVLRDGLMSAGIIVLENDALTLEQDGSAIQLLGLMDPSFGGSTAAALEALMTDSEAYTILLSHRPELFDTYVQSGVDLVFTGHAHGGQIRLPFIGGLAAPGQGLFPEYDSGLYSQGATNMIVSRGLGNSIFPFRFNNRPEVVVATLLPNH